MMLDKGAIEKLLLLDDATLATVIRRLAAGAGLNISDINIEKKDLDNIRQALSLATEGDMSYAMDMINNFKRMSGK